MQVVRALLDGGAVDFAGEHYEIAGHTAHPTRPRIPLLVGGNGNRVLALAAGTRTSSASSASTRSREAPTSR